ncbi:DUF421 domain-containing protein [Nocardioides sp. SYSU DS0651]|uniref:DUF421 domain-containing protein n=1 Tax=Nocardioides sp. SYSU DS0651 TaxID=3415955 RepID=UPI003F4C697D
MWFDSWSDVLRILVVGCAAYAWLVVLLRITGKRTLAKLNAFDFVVTVALGSTLSSILLDSRVAWLEGAVALATLVLLQLVVALVTSRVGAARRAVTAGPSVLLWDGRPRPDALTKHRVGLEALRQAVRSTGSGDLGDVAAVVLETDGTLSVIPRSRSGNLSALEDVPR